MENKISITEEDLFRFVFYKNELSEEKRIYLEENRELFAEELNFLRSFEQNTIEVRSADVNVPSNVMILRKDTSIQRSRNGRLKLAAASETITKNIETATFKDGSQNYLVRQVIEKDKNQLFLFPRLEDKSVNISIALFPSKLKYHSSKTATTIDLPLNVSVDEILVTEE
jgi:hypothetical protein